MKRYTYYLHTKVAILEENRTRADALLKAHLYGLPCEDEEHPTDMTPRIVCNQVIEVEFVRSETL